MKTWKIPVTWAMQGVVIVEASTLAEAVEIIRNDNKHPIPNDSEYLGDSWDVATEDADYLRKWYNDNQQDE